LSTTKYILGEDVDDALLNLRTQIPIDLLQSPCCVLLYSTVAQTIGTVTWIAINFTSEFVDQPSPGGHSTSTNISRWIPSVAGTYDVYGQVAWNANATGARGTRIMKNGAGIDTCPYSMQGNSGGADINTPRTQGMVTMNGSTDYLELDGYQASGGNLNTFYGAGLSGSLLVASLRTL
jgi:hypothetical protein